MHPGFAIALGGVLLLAATAGGPAAEPKTGSAAVGGWKDDAPGVIRQLRPADLPPADTRASRSNGPDQVRRPDGAMPKVPDGFAIELIASGIRNPRAIRFAPNGDLFIADSAQNQLLLLPGGRPGTPQVFAARLHQPYGIAFYPPGLRPQWIYIANSDGLIRYPYVEGEPKPAWGPQTILFGIPANHHWTRDVVFSADGNTMFFSVGSGSNVGEGMPRSPQGGLDAWVKAQAPGAAWGSEARRADVLAFTPEGKDERVLATGLRNCAGMTLQPATGQLWCVVNERDGLGDNVPFEYATHVADGAFYGWPWYFIGGHEDPRHAGARPDLKDKVTVPDVLMQAHSAPLNIAFFDSDAWGPDYRGDAFVALHGSWNRGVRTGYKVVRLKFDPTGKAVGTYEDFVTGFVLDDDSVWGRPVGVAVSPDGALYISEDAAGTIWRISPIKPPTPVAAPAAGTDDEVIGKAG